MASTKKKNRQPPPTVEIISKEMIKPSQPTPSQLRNYQISSLDQFSDHMSYIRVLYFYSGQDIAISGDPNHIIQLLKNSLSQTLTHYYPLAGKFLTDRAFIHCDDSGAEFTTAVVMDQDGNHSHFSGIIENPNIDFLDKLVSRDDSVPKSDDVILAVQVTYFNGGAAGFTVGVSISHTISDASTLCSFLKCWSAAANMVFSGEPCFQELTKLGPIFDAPRLWPPLPGLTRPSFDFSKRETIIMKKLVFSSSSLARLKNDLSAGDDGAGGGDGGGGGGVPTRVTSVMALIWHAVMNSLPAPRPDKHVLTMSVNIRGKISPPLTDNTFGNVGKLAAVEKCGGAGDEITPPLSDMQLILGLIKEAIGKVDEAYAKMLGAPIHDPFLTAFASANLNITVANSWCRLPFYEVNLGLSKPIWMTCLRRPSVHDILLLDGPNGGIDVLIGLNEETMEKFEKNPTLLYYCDNHVTYG